MSTQQEFKLSVKVAVRNDDGAVLLLKRSMESKGNPGKWDLPGGKVEEGETFDKAAIRETLEETGLNVKIIHVIGAGESEAPKYRVAYLIVEAQILSGNLKTSEEHDDFIWVQPQQFESMELCNQFKQPLLDYASHCVPAII